MLNYFVYTKFKEKQTRDDAAYKERMDRSKTFKSISISKGQRAR